MEYPKLNNMKMKTTIFFLVSFTGLMLGLSSCNYDRPLRRELLSIWNEDQGSRLEWQYLWQKHGEGSPKVDSIIQVVHRLDSLHLIRIEKILDEKGWVGKDKVGKLANNTFFIVIQHADLKTQEKYLPMMRLAVREGRSEASWLALLEDRVALGEGKKQIYGSQIYYDKKSKKSFVAPLEDPDQVDARRKAVGLGPLADYVKQWKMTWNAEEYKKQLPELEKIDVGFFVNRGSDREEREINIRDVRNQPSSTIDKDTVGQAKKAVRVYRMDSYPTPSGKILKACYLFVVNREISGHNVAGKDFMIVSDNEFDKARYKWTDDKTVKVRLFNSSGSQSEDYALTQNSGGSSSLGKTTY